MKRTISVCIAISFALVSYAAPAIGKVIKKSYQAYSKDMPVLVCWSEEDVPLSAELLGTIQITDHEGRNCLDSVSVLNLLKKEARKVGGNTLHVTAHRTNGNCHLMMASILRVSEAYLRSSFPDEFADAMSPYIPKRQNKLSSTRFEVGVDYALRTAGIPDGLTPMFDYYVTQLRSGVGIHASFDFFPVKYFGLGIMYYTYRSHADMWVSTDLQGGGDAMICRDAINFIAPALLLRSPIGSKWMFDTRIAPGYINYREKLSLLKETASAKGGSIGFHAAISAEYKLNDYFGFFFNISTTQGWISKYKVEGSIMDKETIRLTSDDVEALSHINFGAGFRFHIN